MAKPLDVDALLQRFPSRFESRPMYSHGCLTWYFEDTDHYADYINPYFTLYRAFNDRRVIGFQLRVVKRLAK